MSKKNFSSNKAIRNSVQNLRELQKEDSENKNKSDPFKAYRDYNIPSQSKTDTFPDKSEKNEKLKPISSTLSQENEKLIPNRDSRLKTDFNKVETKQKNFKIKSPEKGFFKSIKEKVIDKKSPKKSSPKIGFDKTCDKKDLDKTFLKIGFSETTDKTKIDDLIKPSKSVSDTKTPKTCDNNCSPGEKPKCKKYKSQSFVGS